MPAQPRLRSVVVAADQALIADVLCAALAARGFGILRWRPDLDPPGDHLGLLLVDPSTQDGRALTESVLRGPTPHWVIVAAAPPDPEWLDAVDPIRVEVLDASTPLDELTATLLARSSGSVAR